MALVSYPAEVNKSQASGPPKRSCLGPINGRLRFARLLAHRDSVRLDVTMEAIVVLSSLTHVLAKGPQQRGFAFSIARPRGLYQTVMRAH